jgi:hypothetical protein
MLLKNLLFISIFSATIVTYGQGKAYDIRTIAFYNVENLFDTINNPKKFDDDRTPTGKDGYTSKIYLDKIDKLSRVLSEIGRKETQTSPVILGVCEIENRAVLEDLVTSKKLIEQHYGIVHYDSPDERGIDVALLYQKRYFKPISHKTHKLLIFKDDGKRDFTRDQLVVSGILDSELIHVIVNHWPSRSGGEAKSRPFRIAAAKLNKKIIDSLQQIDSVAKIITMGDLNDDPDSPSIKKILKAKEKKTNVKPTVGLYNPMADMHRRGFNTLAYRDNLNLFDQIIFTQPFLEKDYSSYRFYKAGIYNKRYLITDKGPFKGYPFRSYNYNTYQGGYSDHFPVYIYLIKEKK